MTIDINSESNILFIAEPLSQGDTDNYGFDATAFLDGDTINTCDWAIKLAGISNSDVTINSSDITSDTIVTVNLSSNNPDSVGKTYAVYGTFVTAGGITRTYGFMLPCI